MAFINKSVSVKTKLDLSAIYQIFYLNVNEIVILKNP